jgi:NAD(P)-dependent dehydrogenase (short-subunit alcohol dehydrogenase family)
VARECEEKGASAIAVVTDVTDEEAVKRLAEKAVERFGKIDVWVNNAAVSLFARFEEAPGNVFRQVIETNLFGTINGIRSVLPYMREQGRGTIINVSSIVAGAPQPYTSAYVSSKYAINGLTECLRMELSLDEAPEIQICTVMPASIDTPIFSNAANYTGRGVKALNPVYSPKSVARTIVSVAKYPKRKVISGEAGRLMLIHHAIMPGLYEKLGAQNVDNDHLKKEPTESGEGNVFEPSNHTGMENGWREKQVKPVKAYAAFGASAVFGLSLAWFAGKQLMRIGGFIK